MAGNNQIWFTANVEFISVGNTDDASLGGANMQLGSWNGIGLTTTCGSQFIPVGAYGVAFSTRDGGLMTAGPLRANDSRENLAHQIQNLVIVRHGGDQTIDAGVAYTAGLLSNTPVSGGSGVNVSDRYLDRLRQHLHRPERFRRRCDLHPDGQRRSQGRHAPRKPGHADPLPRLQWHGHSGQSDMDVALAVREFRTPPARWRSGGLLGCSSKPAPLSG